MFKLLKILLFSSLTLGANAFKCFTPKDVYNKGLVSYQGKVYDLSNYDTHPAGKDILLQAYGKPLEYFFNMPVYKFHVGKLSVKNDFEILFLGNLQDDCNVSIIPKNETEIQNINYDFIIENNLLNFGWYISGDSIYFIAKTKIYNNHQWVGIRINDSNNVIIAWIDKNNRLNIDLFDVFTKAKSQTSLIYKNIIIENNSIFKLQFSNYLNQTDIDFSKINKLSYYIGDTFLFTNILKNFNYTDSFYVNFRTGYVSDENKEQTNPNNDDELLEYYPSIGTSTVFIVIFFISLVITHTKSKNYHFFNRFTKLGLMGCYSNGTLIFGSIYLLWWISILIYSFMKIEEIVFRLGIWVSLNLAFSLLPITRNSIWVILFNLSHDRLISIHKLIAICSLLSGIIKFIAVTVYYNPEYLILLTNGNGGNPLMGTIATISITITSLLAIPYIRNNMFELFFYSHKIFCILTIIAGVLHYTLVLYYLIPSIILYILDIIIRYFKTRKSIYSKIDVIGYDKYDTCSILLNVSLLKNIKVEPGSYFFICYDDISKFEWHPLSIISNEHGNLTFCIKDMGENTWSGKLKKFQNNTFDNSSLIKRNVYIQGPYGHLNLDYKNNIYENLIFVAGGIGITPIIPILNDINTLYSNYQLSNMKKIYFIWIVKHSSLIVPFQKYFDNLNLRLFNINFFSTNKNNYEQDYNGNMFSNILIKIEKPNITNIINSIIIDNKIPNKNIAVSCCGPNRLTGEVISVCSKLNIEVSTQNF
jgi:predicted ferric reductase